MSTLDTPVTAPKGQPIWDTVIRFGGLNSAAAIVIAQLFYLSGLNVFSFSGMALSFGIIMLVSFVFAFLSMRHQRDQLDNGLITYGKALLVGFLVLFAGGIVSGIWNYVLINFIDPNYISALKEQFMNTWGEAMPADQLEKTMEQFDKSGEFLTALKGGIINGAIFSIIVSLITAAFVKREPKMDYMR